MTAIYLADKQENWNVANHLEENLTGLPISSKIMVEARKAAKLLNPGLMVTIPTVRRAREEDRDRGETRDSARDYDRRDMNRTHSRRGTGR